MLATIYLQCLNVQFRFLSLLRLHLHFLSSTLGLPLPTSLRHSFVFSGAADIRHAAAPAELDSGVKY